MPVAQSLNEDGFESISGRKLSIQYIVHMPSELQCDSVNYQTLDFHAASITKTSTVLLGGYISCPSTAVLGFFHLLKKKLLGIRLVGPIKSECFTVWPQEEIKTVRIFAKNAAFDGTSESSLTWHKSMHNVMIWLRPELSIKTLYDDREDFTLGKEDVGNNEEPSNTNKIYDAVKPSGKEPTLDIQLEGLFPELRPYQRRAAYWMVQRERGPLVSCSVGLDAVQDSSSASTSFEEEQESILQRSGSPIWIVVHSIDKSHQFFYNPFSGCISREPRDCYSYVHGGILADEMGLGKTVELLACILANPYKIPLGSYHSADKAVERLQDELQQRRHERIDCPCGTTVEEEEDTRGWVQCDACDAWQHMYCVGYGSEFTEQKLFDRWVAAVFNGNIGIKEGRKKSGSSMGTRKARADGGMKRSRNAAKKYSTKLNDVVGDERNEESFICGECAELIANTEVEGDCGTTLIVCPTSILHQWQEEIKMHTKRGALRVIVYQGVGKGCFTVTDSKTTAAEKSYRFGIVCAADLAAADIVITTYDILRSDLFHDANMLDANRCLRYNKRYRMIPTPLTKLRWWRICLDEAQMVESNTARATEMALRLHSEHSWCITGTPIQCGLDDLFGLLRFLKAEPFNDYRWWTQALKEPYEEGKGGAKKLMHSFLRKFMWRSTKAQVANELNLPSQEVKVSWLNFSAIERHFYEGQHERCANKAREVINYIKKAEGQLSQPKSDNMVIEKLLSHAEAAKLMNPLLRLRQACCHPQVGSAGIRSLQRRPMTMDEILGVLIENTRCEGEEAQRNMVGALNGLAALAIIESNFLQAVSVYREVLASTHQNEDKFRVDPLQKLHTLHNLADVLGLLQDVPVPGTDLCMDGNQPIDKHIVESAKSSIPRTLRDDFLLKECQEVRGKYMSPLYSKLAVAREDFESSYKQVLDIRKWSTWWLEALTIIQKSKKNARDLTKKIRDSLLETDHLQTGQNHSNASSLALRFRDMNGLKLVLQVELDAIASARGQLMERLTEIDKQMDNPGASLVENAGFCPQCQPSQSGPLCTHCKMDELFQAYENRLFLLRASANETISAEAATDAQQRAFNRHRLGEVLKSLSHKTPYVVDGKRDKGASAGGVARVIGHPSETERILSIIKTYAKGILGGDEATAAKQQLQSLAAMRKEWLQARALAVAQRNVLYAFSELSISTVRLSVWCAGEGRISKSEELAKLHPEEVPAKNAELTAEKFEALNFLHRAKGQLRYLEGLAKCRGTESDKNQVTKETSSDSFQPVCSTSIDSEDRVCTTKDTSIHDHVCPVCQEKLGPEKMVLPCCHLLCCKCVVTMIERKHSFPSNSSQDSIFCPSCRRRANYGDIMYVNDESKACSFPKKTAKLDEDTEESLVQVEGSYGTKMEAVVRRVLWIQSKEKHAKILIFSSWHDVLDVVEHALLANNITFARVKGNSKINSAIQEFKGTIPQHGGSLKNSSRRLVSKTVLLLPIKLGANGLNLVEAQHVILVEPLLNPAAEAQAINRVHRIGQQFATFVHRFIISETIEESIYKLGQTKMRKVTAASHVPAKRKQEENLLTLTDLSTIFDIDGRGNPSTTILKTPTTTCLRSLPPSMAAAAAAEARLNGASKNVNFFED
ncbi:hypothetical protein O6H91_07G028200 [Diphasiastrum complanatum]|nr:hypothetical protein O6H91_07G028200 [Diphasiastrum complanatum]